MHKICRKQIEGFVCFNIKEVAHAFKVFSLHKRYAFCSDGHVTATKILYIQTQNNSTKN